MLAVLGVFAESVNRPGPAKEMDAATENTSREREATAEWLEISPTDANSALVTEVEDFHWLASGVEAPILPVRVDL